MIYDLCIIGGAGRVGLPLGVAFANSNIKTILFDINKDALNKINNGIFPFKEKRGNTELKRALKKRKLFVSDSPEVISRSKYVLIIISTPIDKYLNPDFRPINNLITDYLKFFKNGQIVILRSTVFPGTSEKIQRYFRENKKIVKVAFCPERTLEGESLNELKKLPQIISAFDKVTLKKVEALFKKITKKEIIYSEPIEAELAKLFTNAWRYIRFAVANQFFMIANDYNLDYSRIHKILKHGYERNKDLPSPGFSAGPCLLKDTMQLSAFNKNNFFLGHSALLINEGLPNFLIQGLKRAVDLTDKTIGILGMAFKAETDDIRDSLSVKLRKIAETECKKILCHDFYIKDATFVPLETLLKDSDIIILAAPHKRYKDIKLSKYKDKIFIDIWGFWNKKI